MGLDIDSEQTNWGFKGKNYLFIIGIDKYVHWSPLKCAVKDVQDFAKLLTSRYQFEESDVIMLKDEEATENNIINMFIELSEKKITGDDNLIVYFSGHGCEKAKTGYWVPVDAPRDQPGQFIDTAIIANWLKNINSLHTFLIVDACFSGKLVTQLKGTAARSEKYKSRRIFTSGRAEVVADGQEGQNSPFAKGLLLTLGQNTKPFIYASRLIADVKEYVEREAKQKPMDASIVNADDEGGEFVFHLKLSEEEIWASVVKQHNKDVYFKFVSDFPNSVYKEEAIDAHDWLTASEKNTITALNKYIIDHVLTGKFIEQAKERLDEATWNKAQLEKTILAFAEYIRQFPQGKHVTEAREAMAKIQKSMDTTAEEVEIAKERELLPPDPVLAAKTDEDAAWKNAERSNTFLAYLDFVQRFPKSDYAAQAKKRMEELDNLAANAIKFTVARPDVNCEEKINKCIEYFRNFPSAPNNDIVKKIKNKLLMDRYTKGKC
jgi:hypothetical protein